MTPSGSVDRLALSDLRERQARGERQRRLFWFALACGLLAVLVLGALVWGLYMGREQSREFYNEKNQQQDRQIEQLHQQIARLQIGNR